MKIPRTPWPPSFPQVIVHTDEALRDAHPDYVAAKSGNPAAAAALVQALLSQEKVEQARRLISGRSPIIAPIRAVETTGINLIPNAFGHELGQRLALSVSADIVQTNTVGHTRASGFHRLAFQPTFAGPVLANRDYILVDDHVGLGGTLANLRGYIERAGGAVTLAVTLTASRRSEVLALRAETLQALREKHGEPLEEYWRERFGFGLDALTEAEAGYLFRTPSVDAIRDRLAEADRQGISGGL